MPSMQDLADDLREHASAHNKVLSTHEISSTIAASGQNLDEAIRLLGLPPRAGGGRAGRDQGKRGRGYRQGAGGCFGFALPAAAARRARLGVGRRNFLRDSALVRSKWHLGFYNWASTPTFRGFDSFYGFYEGSEDYFKHTTSQFDLHREPTPRCGEGCSPLP